MGNNNQPDNMSVVLLKLEIQNQYLPKTNQSEVAEKNDYIPVGISPKARLRKKPIFLNSMELAKKFEQFLRESFESRKYSDAYKISLVSDANKLAKSAKVSEKEIKKDSKQVAEMVVDVVLSTNQDSEGFSQANKTVNLGALLKEDLKKRLDSLKAQREVLSKANK